MSPLNNEKTYSELYQEYTELLDRVSKFNAIEQKLINTNDQLDRDLEIYKKLNKFNNMALSAIEITEMLKICSEFIIDLLEIETSVVLVKPGDKNIKPYFFIEGARLINDSEKTIQEIEFLFNSTPINKSSINYLSYLDEHKYFEDFEQVISYRYFCDENNCTLYLAGFNSKKNLRIYNKLGEKEETTFNLFSQQAILIIIGIFSRKKILNQIETISHSTHELKKLSMIATKTNNGVIISDSNGIIEWVNDSFTQITGYTLEEVKGQFPGKILQGINTDPATREAINKTIKEKKRIELNLINYKKDGKEIIVNLEIVPVFNEKNEHTNFIGIQKDITSQKNAEKDKEKMINEIINRNKDLEQFSYIISHNLRAPVANILGITNYLQASDSLNETEKTLLDGMNIAVGKLDDVIKDINAVLKTRQMEGQQKEKIKISDIIRDIIITIENLIVTNHVKIITDFSLYDEIFSVKSYIYSILYNLISNSIKYKQPDLAPVIEISTKRQEDKFLIIYKDNGLGIDLEKKGNEVFGLYKRFHNHVEGKGMGLYMVRTQLKQLRGEITLTSEINKGTEFRIEFAFSDIICDKIN